MGHLKNYKIKKPIFIVGTVRSGTTILSEYLSKNKEIISPGFELRREWHKLTGIEIALPESNQSNNCPPYNQNDFSDEEYSKMRDNFSQFFQENGGSNNLRLLNKNPHLFNKLPFVKRLFPDSYLIVTSRPIINTVASTKWLWEWIYNKFGVKHYLPLRNEDCWSCSPPANEANFEKERIFPGGDVKTIAEYWLRVYETIAIHRSLYEGAFFPVKHRDFLNSPKKTIDEICNYVGIKTDFFNFPRIDRGRENKKLVALNKEELSGLEEYIERQNSRIVKLDFVDQTLSF